jgi:hypothetical protein
MIALAGHAHLAEGKNTDTLHEIAADGNWSL